MTFDWDDKFHYGMFRGSTVRNVRHHKPSYLVWTTIYTAHKFTPEIMEVLKTLVRRGPNRQGMTRTLVRRFGELYMDGWQHPRLRQRITWGHNWDDDHDESMEADLMGGPW